MRLKLEAHEDYQRIRGDYSLFILVSVIKGLTFRFDGHKHPPHTLNDAKIYFHFYYQTG